MSLGINAFHPHSGRARAVWHPATPQPSPNSVLCGSGRKNMLFQDFFAKTHWYCREAPGLASLCRETILRSTTALELSVDFPFRTEESKVQPAVTHHSDRHHPFPRTVDTAPKCTCLSRSKTYTLRQNNPTAGLLSCKTVTEPGPCGPGQLFPKPQAQLANHMDLALGSAQVANT